MASHLYPPSRSHYDSLASSMMPMKPQNNVAPVKDACATETAQKKTASTATAPQLQIPSSINNSKGSLAEFAALVSTNAPMSL